jgi:hypothetical protein
MISVLFARADSNYKTIPDVDVWDAERDALTWPGGTPVVAHPPCRAWGRLRHFAKPRPDEKALAYFAIEAVRKFGGVLEHPASSTLWPDAGLPAPGKRDQFGGWTLGVNQHWWGHRAEKKTLLYICGVEPRDIPPLPLRLDDPTHIVGSSRRKSAIRLPEVSKAEREHTPPDFAVWLVELARRCRPS